MSRPGIGSNNSGGQPTASGATEQQVESIDLNSASRHSHANKSVLDNSTAPFTTAEKSKLGNLSERFRGVYADLAAAQSDVTSPTGGMYFANSATATLWSYNAGSSQWVDTGINTAGDMLASIYDPQNVGADAFDRANHTGSQATSTVAGLDDEIAKIADCEAGIAALGGKSDVIWSASRAQSTATAWNNMATIGDLTIRERNPSNSRFCLSFLLASTATAHSVSFSQVEGAVCTSSVGTINPNSTYSFQRSSTTGDLTVIDVLFNEGVNSAYRFRIAIEYASDNSVNTTIIGSVIK